MDETEFKITMYLLNKTGQSASLEEIYANAGVANMTMPDLEAALSMMIDNYEGFSLTDGSYVLEGANVTTPMAKAALAETIKLQEAAETLGKFLEETSSEMEDMAVFDARATHIADFTKLAVWNAHSAVEKGLVRDAGLMNMTMLMAVKALYKSLPSEPMEPPAPEAEVVVPQPAQQPPAAPAAAAGLDSALTNAG